MLKFKDKTHFTTFSTFEKVGDEDDRLVTMIAADTIKDSQGDRFTPECLKKMAERFMSDPQGRNMREMHENIAAGNALHYQILEDGAISKWMLHTEVTDPNTWHKIKKNTLKGASVGGEALEWYYENEGTTQQTRIITDAFISEVSYVDRPAQPGAEILFYKRQAPIEKGDIMAKEKEAKSTDEPQARVDLSEQFGAALKKAADVAADKADDTGLPAVGDLVDGMLAWSAKLLKDGETDRSQLCHQGAILFNEGAGASDQDDNGDDALAADTDDAGANDAGAVGKAAKTGKLKKVGRKINLKNQEILFKSAMGIFQSLADAGHADAQEIMERFKGMPGANSDTTMTEKAYGIADLKKSIETVVETTGKDYASIVRVIEKFAEVVSGFSTNLEVVGKDAAFTKSVLSKLPDSSRTPARFEAGKELPSNAPVVVTPTLVADSIISKRLAAADERSNPLKQRDLSIDILTAMAGD